MELTTRTKRDDGEERGQPFQTGIVSTPPYSEEIQM